MSTRSTSAAKTAAKRAALKPLYKASNITKSTNSNLWVTFIANKPSKGLVFSSTLTRDEARNQTRKAFGLANVNDVRSRRVSNYRKLVK